MSTRVEFEVEDEFEKAIRQVFRKKHHSETSELTTGTVPGPQSDLSRLIVYMLKQSYGPSIRWEQKRREQSSGPTYIG